MPPGGWPDRTTPEALRKSLDKAHDNLHHVVRENDRLRAASLKLHERLRWLLKVFLCLMGVSFSLLGWVLKFLIPYAIRGMAR